MLRSRVHNQFCLKEYRMGQFLVGGARPAPAVDHSRLPANIDPNIIQPTDPIIKYMQVLSIDRSKNKTYKCKQCGHKFTGQPCNLGSNLKKGFLRNEL